MSLGSRNDEMRMPAVGRVQKKAITKTLIRTTGL
jgi:hypothetical protein